MSDAQPSNFDAETYLDAMASVLDLTITPAQRPGVLQFLKTAAVMAHKVRTAPVATDTLELAPVFMPAMSSSAP